MTQVNPQSTPKSYATLILAAWLIVGVPACWGVFQTFRTSLQLFEPQPVAAGPTTAPTTMPMNVTSPEK
jgi:hypothetical protein